MSSDLRLVRLGGEGSGAVRGDGTDASLSRDALASHLQALGTGATTRAIDITTHHQPAAPPISTSTSTTPVTDRPVTETPPIHPTTPTADNGGQTVARPVEAPKDDFAKKNTPAWPQFMDDMTGALDIALAVSDAAKDGKVDPQEWAGIFAKANQDGQLSLIEIAGMYAGLQDMHNKGVLNDTQYQDAVASLDAELGARYTGNTGQGLDNLAQIYLDQLAADPQAVQAQNDQGGNGHGANGKGNDQVHGDVHIGKGHDEGNDGNDVEDVTKTNNALRQQVNDDNEEGAITRERQAGRRNDINAGLATALTDIGINRKVDEVDAGRRGEGHRGHQ